MSSPPCPPPSHTQFLPFFPLPVFKGLKIPCGKGLGASERLQRILITLEQPELDSILSDAF